MKEIDGRSFENPIGSLGDFVDRTWTRVAIHEVIGARYSDAPFKELQISYLEVRGQNVNDVVLRIDGKEWVLSGVTLGNLIGEKIRPQRRRA